MLTIRPDPFWGLVMSFWIGNVLLLILKLSLGGLGVRLLTIPYRLLFPAILVFVCMGVYSIDRNAFDVWLALAFGVLGYGMRLLELPLAPLILGFVLGPATEESFRRSMMIAQRDLSHFFQRPVSGFILVATILLLAATGPFALRRRRRQPSQ